MTEAQEPEDLYTADYSYLRGAPTGDLKWIHQFDTYVRTYEEPRLDLITSNYKDTIQYHVPREFRGKYRPSNLPDGYLSSVVWDVDRDGFVLCTGITIRGVKCRRQAQNRSGYCEAHGGALHPLDRVEYATEPTSLDKSIAHNERMGRDLERVGEYSRWDQLLLGIISVEDLDDEELARGQCRGPNGRFGSAPPRMVPRELHDQMMKQLLSRAQQKFREGLLGSIDALNKIAQGDAFEPADRIKAAGMVIDRVMGKTPEILFTAETKAPWEEIFASISRDPGDNAAYQRLEAAIDAEVVDERPLAEEPQYTKRFGTPPNEGQLSEHLTEVTPPTLVGEPTTDFVPLPPQDPGLRQKYEEETSQTLRDRIKAGRAKRYVARATGRDTISNLPFGMDKVEIYPETEESEGVYQIKLINPGDTKVPKHVLSKESRQRKYDR